MTARQICLGHVSGVYGVRGWVKVYSYTQPREGIVKYRRWHLYSADSGEWLSDCAVTEGRLQGKQVVAKLQGIDDREQALALIGQEIRIDRAELQALEQGHYYWADLIGLKVQDTQQKVLGVVDYLMETGTHDVMVLAGSGQQLIPFAIPEVVRAVDLEAGTITVDWDPSYWE